MTDLLLQVGVWKWTQCSDLRRGNGGWCYWYLKTVVTVVEYDASLVCRLR